MYDDIMLHILLMPYETSLAFIFTCLTVVTSQSVALKSDRPEPDLPKGEIRSSYMFRFRNYRTLPATIHTSIFHIIHRLKISDHTGTLANACLELVRTKTSMIMSSKTSIYLTY